MVGPFMHLNSICNVRLLLCVVISETARSFDDCWSLKVDNNISFYSIWGLICFVFRTVGSGKNASGIWDRLVFNKIKDKLGGRVRFMTSGASPLSPEVMEFMKM